MCLCCSISISHIHLSRKSKLYTKEVIYAFSGVYVYVLCVAKGLICILLDEEVLGLQVPACLHIVQHTYILI